MNENAVQRAARENNIANLVAALAVHPELIDVPDYNGSTPLFVAAIFGHGDVVEVLVRSGSKAIDQPNEEGWTPLYAAAWQDHVAMIELLVRLGSNALDTPNHDGCTPMYAAAEFDRLSAIETLVRLGSKAIDTPNIDDSSPMHVAAMRGHVSVIEALVRLGSKALDALNRVSWGPITIAAFHGNTAAIEALVRLGSTVDTPDETGMTALYYAILQQHAESINVLLALGADPLLVQQHLLPNQLQQLPNLPSEEATAEVRYRVFFAAPLVDRLLFELARNNVTSPPSAGSNKRANKQKCVMS